MIESLENANPKVKETGKLTSEGVYFGTNQDDPQIGDQKVDFNGRSDGASEFGCSATGPHVCRL